MKTKLGISVGLMGAAVYFLVLLGGFVPALLLTGYIFLFESNEWLKKSAIKALMISIIFSILAVVLGFIPNAISLVNSIFNMFGSSFHLNFISGLVGFINTILTIAEKLLLLFLGFIALHQGSINLGIVDRIIDEHIVKPTE